MSMKKKIIRPTAKEDAAITKAAMSDPDSLPFTDEEWEKIRPRLVRGKARLVVSRTNNSALINNKLKNTA